MSEELKPCPYCGGEAEPFHEGLGYIAVRCKKCGIARRGFYTWDAAIAAWNTRADDAELDWVRAENARLREECERAWRERNIAVAKVRAWEATVVVEKLPYQRAHRVDEWGPSEGETIVVPEVTPRRLTEILDELATLRAARGEKP